ncbi:MAG: hypothetical protein WA705_15375 [Candidatus Ozemobacteraceae bacterium]
MSFLSPAHIKSWYVESLRYSGFNELYAFPRDYWKNAVIHGRRGLPPGFLAALYERLTRRDAGSRGEVSISALEQELFSRICQGDGFDRLEGMFILAGSRDDPTFAEGVLDNLLDRLPDFIHPMLQMAPRDLATAFGDEISVDPLFSALPLIEHLYQEAIDTLTKKPFCLTPVDVFEIGHPALFRKPSDRIFYRRLMRTLNGISLHTSAVFTLHEEAAMVVARFGEPQVLPLGGYDSLTNQGDIASLVPSELGYIDETMPVDLFDVKFMERQLLYFKREEGSVFRIRRDVRLCVELTPFMEHERHLALLFGWCLVLSEKLLEVFTKDIVRVRVELSGYKASALADAGEFFRHFLREKGNAERISLHLPDDPSLAKESEPNPLIVQCWSIGLKKSTNAKHLDALFPQTDTFASSTPEEQERTLGESINHILETMVEHAHR